MTVHHEFKLERQARSLFQVKIGLAGLTVKINIFMTVHHEFKLERQARSLFQVKIGLAGVTVKIKATELNSKACTTESKKF